MQQEQQTGRRSHVILTIPNLLSLLRLLLIPLIIRAYIQKNDCVLTAALVVLSGLTDLADGFIARRFHMISDLGKILDPIADKLTQAAMLICLLLRFPLMIAPLVLMVAKETFMTITGFLVIKHKGIVDGANWHGKVATVLLYGMMILHVFWYEITPVASAISIGLCALMICISFVLYAIRNVKTLKQ